MSTSRGQWTDAVLVNMTTLNVRAAEEHASRWERRCARAEGERPTLEEPELLSLPDNTAEAQ